MTTAMSGTTTRAAMATFDHEIVGMDEPVSNPTCQFTQSPTSPGPHVLYHATRPHPPRFKHEVKPPTLRHVGSDDPTAPLALNTT